MEGIQGRTRLCDHCGRSYTADHRGGARQRYCGTVCKQRALRARRGHQGPRTCGWCGQKYEPNKHTRNRQRFCSVLCGKRFENAQAPKTVSIGEARQCLICGEDFHLDSYRQHRRLYCSQMCKREAASRESQRWHKISGRYRVSREEYNNLIRMNGYLCWICYHPVTGERLAVDAPQLDHDHDTGHVRGILCRRCNTALGSFRDEPWIVESALEYLRFFKEAAPTLDPNYPRSGAS